MEEEESQPQTSGGRSSSSSSSGAGGTTSTPSPTNLAKFQPLMISQTKVRLLSSPVAHGKAEADEDIDIDIEGLDEDEAPDPEEGFPLLELPNDILFLILEFLTAKELSYAASVCHQLRNLAHDDSVIWKRKVERLVELSVPFVCPSDKIPKPKTRSMFATAAAAETRHKQRLAIQRESEKVLEQYWDSIVAFKEREHPTPGEQGYWSWKQLFHDLRSLPIWLQTADLDDVEITFSPEDHFIRVESKARAGANRCILGTTPVPMWSTSYYSDFENSDLRGFRTRRLWYYEITLSQLPLDVPDMDRAVAIGLSAGFSGHYMPGWNSCTFGWHGDDGRVFDNSNIGASWEDGRVNHGDTRFGPGDTVGLGVILPTDEQLSSPHFDDPLWRSPNDLKPSAPKPIIFGTKNGVLMGYFPTATLHQTHLVQNFKPIYPAIGIDYTQGHILVNFGGHKDAPFKFDLEKFRSSKPLPPTIEVFANRPRMIAGVWYEDDDEDEYPDSDDDSDGDWTPTPLPPLLFRSGGGLTSVRGPPTNRNATGGGAGGNGSTTTSSGNGTSSSTSTGGSSTIDAPSSSSSSSSAMPSTGTSNSSEGRRRRRGLDLGLSSEDDDDDRGEHDRYASNDSSSDSSSDLEDTYTPFAVEDGVVANLGWRVVNHSIESDSDE